VLAGVRLVATSLLHAAARDASDWGGLGSDGDPDSLTSANNINHLRWQTYSRDGFEPQRLFGAQPGGITIAPALPGAFLYSIT
jgi:hypothetical protein